MTRKCRVLGSQQERGTPAVPYKALNSANSHVSLRKVHTRTDVVIEHSHEYGLWSPPYFS